MGDNAVDISSIESKINQIVKKIEHIEKASNIRDALLEGREDITTKKNMYISNYLDMEINSSTIENLQNEIDSLNTEKCILYELRENLKKELQEGNELLSCVKENLGITSKQQKFVTSLKSLSSLFQISYKTSHDGKIQTVLFKNKDHVQKTLKIQDCQNTSENFWKLISENTNCFS